MVDGGRCHVTRRKCDAAWPSSGWIRKLMAVSRSRRGEGERREIIGHLFINLQESCYHLINVEKAIGVLQDRDDVTIKTV